MRANVAALLVPAVLLTASCTGNESTPVSPSTYNASTSLSSGVKGDLSFVGGPLVASPTARLLRPGDVVAFAEDGTEAGAIHFSEGQGFSLSLPPGRYRLVATSGDARCPDGIKVTVLPNDYKIVRIRCDVV